MISPLEPAPLVGPAIGPQASRRPARARSFPATRRISTAVPVPETLTVFAEPAFSSLWDLNLLDRLSEPLTRYHE
jgi:hypothetical protein